MPEEILAIAKKGFCLALLILVSFVMSLPRAQEALGPMVSSMSLSGHTSRLSSALIPVPAHPSGADGLDMRLLKVRKFRRRRTNFTFNPHLSVSFLSDPSEQLLGRCRPMDDLMLSREPDPLTHPPA